MNILVLSDNPEVLARAKPIFEKRKVSHWTFTNSDDINPKKDFQHIIDNYELVFSLHCKKIFPKILTDSVRCINIHPGFNPYNRGIFPHVFSIVNGLPAGVTIHEMDAGIDTGPLIVRREVGMSQSDTSAILYNRVIDREMDMIDDWLDYLIDKSYNVFHFQPEEGNYNSMEDFKKLCDFKNSTWEIFPVVFDRLRALSHTGYMNAHYNGIKFKLIIDHTHTKNENINTPTTHTHTE